MKFYEQVKDWYEKGLWSKQMVANAVIKGAITTEQYQEITGETYTV
ncbi:XkdX family protein [Anaerovorax sp. IOR16]|nr:XkdX family protein [Anaerovorax sp. IOR16]